MTRVYIPTAGRPHRQVTLESLPPDVAVLVVPPDEENEYRQANPGATVIPYAGEGIRAKRNWILDMAHTGRIIMMDDDLTFRRRDKAGCYVRAGREDVLVMLASLWWRLYEYAHVGICDEFMSQANGPDDTIGARRYNQVLGYNMDLFGDRGLRMRTEINEEHDLNLQLLEAGLPACVLTGFTKSSKAYAVGGCAPWRTAEVERAGHEELARLHPDTVRVVPLANSLSGWGIRVAWKKALRPSGES